MSDHEPGFTPTLDVIVIDLDLESAAIFGSVWRYCQMPEGVCRASAKTIGARVGLSERTAKDRLYRLAARGWIAADARPGQSTAYTDAGRVVIRPVAVEGRASGARPAVRQAGPVQAAHATHASGARVPVQAAHAIDTPEDTNKNQNTTSRTVATAPLRWGPVLEDIAASFGGVRVVNAKTGHPLARPAQAVAIIGRAAGDDVTRAQELLAEFRHSPSWQYATLANLAERFGKWHADTYAGNGLPIMARY